jgi:hypothetical protein
MTPGEIDDLHLVTPQAARVKEKIEMQPDGGDGHQNGREPGGPEENAFF